MTMETLKENFSNYSFEQDYDYAIYHGLLYDETKVRVYPRPFEWPLIVAYIVIFLLALFGNTLVCVAVLRNEHMRTVTNYYIVNLAVADILVSLICLPATVIGDVSESWFFGDELCSFIPYFQTVSVAVSVYTLMMISVDRYMAICRPLKFQISATRTIATIIVVWIVSFIIMIPNAVFHGTESNGYSVAIDKPSWLKLCYEVHWHGSIAQKFYYVFITVVTYVIPLAVVTASYLNVCIRLWSGIPTVGGGRSSHQDGSEKKTISKTTEAQLKSRRNVARMLIVVVVIFAMCFFPLHLLNLLRVFDVFSKVDAQLKGHQVLVPYLIAHLLAFINSAVNPVIYNFMSAKFRQAFRSVFGCGCSSPNRQPADRPNTKGYNRSFLHSTTAVSESRSHATEYVAMSQMGKGTSNTAWQNT